MKKIVLAGLLISTLGFAQENNTSEPANRINTQFQEIITNSNNFKEYKVVKESDLKKLQANTDSYITELDLRIEELEKKVAVEQEAQEPLQKQLNAAQASVQRLDEEKASISVLGILIEKTVYNVIVWSIVAILGIALIVIYLQFKKSHVVTNHAKSELATAEAELEELRRKSIEEKQQLGRQLQDERNKLSRLRTAN
jgi:LAS superfamily LD-carboxypeptidase LdcB